MRAILKINGDVQVTMAFDEAVALHSELELGETGPSIQDRFMGELAVIVITEDEEEDDEDEEEIEGLDESSDDVEGIE